MATLSFFFQAEDGIRHRTVTGVQTCALPILWGMAVALIPYLLLSSVPSFTGSSVPFGANFPRSEERRVGKECRSRWRRCPSSQNRCRTRRHDQIILLYRTLLTSPVYCYHH